MTKSDKIIMFREMFKGREDIVPRHWASFKTGRSGYSPICGNEWRRPECQKGIRRGACHICKTPAYKPFSDSLICDHFMGRHVLGVYPLLLDHTCHFVAADFDDHSGDRSPLEDVLAYYEACHIQDIPCHVLRSKSGKGYHAFVFFEKPVPAWKARVVGFALLGEASVIGEDADISSFDRLFPNQDCLSGKGMGNLIALPFQGGAARKGHTLLLSPESGFAEPYASQWDALAGVRKSSESALDGLIREWRLTRSERQTSQTSKISGMFRTSSVSRTYPPSDFNRIAEKCAFIAHCRDDARDLSEPDWYMLLTISARCENGRHLSHKLSETYPRYTYQETDAKIHQALNNTGPYCCRTIRRISGAYCKTCRYYGRVKSPIVLGWKHRIWQNTGQTYSLSRTHYALTTGERQLIHRYYEFYQALDNGTRKPGTRKQKQFIWVCRGWRDPRTIHERTYLKYKAAISGRIPGRF